MPEADRPTVFPVPPTRPRSIPEARWFPPWSPLSTGATAFVLLKRFLPDAPWVPVARILVTLVIRLATIRWELKLPIDDPNQTDSNQSK